MERDLILAARHGDREAFVDLVHPRVDRLYSLALRVLRDADQADDAVQDALVLAWRDLRALRDVDRFDAWLRRILLNVCMRDMRRQRSRPVTVGELPLDEPSPADELGALDERDRLERAFHHITADQRVVLALRHYLGYTPDEIAEALDIAPGTAKSRLHYAHRAMRSALEAETRRPVLEGRTA